MRVINEKKKENVRLEPISSLWIKSSDGDTRLLRNNTISDVIEIESGENKRLVFKIEDWKLTTLSLSNLLKSHLKSAEQSYDQKFDSILADTTRSGKFHLKPPLGDNQLTAVIKCFNHQSITTVSLAGINLSSHCQEGFGEAQEKVSFFDKLSSNKPQKGSSKLDQRSKKRNLTSLGKLSTNARAPFAITTPFKITYQA